jgi:diguanylate cyclase (GGDEF)-like protein/PAS domain S-box-containing protein
MGSTLRILFVCLLPSGVDVLTNVLRKSGFEVVSEKVDDPDNLPTQLNNNYDLVLVDSLTQHRGLVETMLGMLRQKSLDIPLLVYSSARDEALIVGAMKAGAQDFITSQNPQRLVLSVKRELAAVQERTAMRKEAQFDALLQEIDGLMLAGWDVAPIALRICQQAMSLCDLRMAWIGGKQADGSVGVVAAAGDVDYLGKIEVRWDAGPYADGPVGTAINKRMAVAAKVDDPDFTPWRVLAEQHGMQSVLAVPMVVRDEIIGVLGMYAARRDNFDAASVKRYTKFAYRLAITLMMAQEHQQFRLLSVAMNKATQAIFITTHDGKIIWFNHALTVISGYSAQEIMDSTPHLFSSGSYEKAFWEDMWRDILDGKVWNGDVLNRRKDGALYSVLQSITPMYDEEGNVSHFLCLQQDVSEKKELEQKIEYLAYHDILTGLPNRTLFNDRMNQAITQAKRDHAEFSLLFVDLDGFKDVNDMHGHAAGDQLLQMVAERLRSCVREGDTVARLGGDEFIVLLRDVSDHAGLMNITQKIIERIADRYELGDAIANVTASIGISRYPHDAVLAEKLLTCADEAMYAAKHGGKNRYALWGSTTQIKANSDWQI